MRQESDGLDPNMGNQKTIDDRSKRGGKENPKNSFVDDRVLWTRNFKSFYTAFDFLKWPKQEKVSDLHRTKCDGNR